MKPTEKISAFVEKAGLYIVGGLTAVFSFFIFAASMLHTVTVDAVSEGEGMHSIVNEIPEKLESVIYYNDNLFLNIVYLVLCLLICFLIAPRLKNVKLPYKLGFVFLWTFIAGTVWVLSSQSAPSEDSAMVTGASMQAANGDLSFFDIRYFHNYSFQLGYVFFNELLIRAARLFHEPQNLLFLEVMNAFFLAVINTFAVMLNDRLFKDARVTNITAVLLALSAAPIISCSFIYGLLPGMAFSMIALYCEMRYLLDNKVILGILSAVCIAIAYMIKSNYLIWLIAMVLIFVVMTIGKIRSKRSAVRYLADAVMLVLIIVPAMCIQPAVKSMYERRSGTEIGDAVPYVSWIALGLNESDLAPGWYSYYFTLTNFEDSGFDADVASGRSKEVIKERIKYFRENPQYTNDFFYKKAVSQWNETSYESIWNNIVRYQYSEKKNPAAWVCGDGKTTAKKYIDIFSQLVFCGFFAASLLLLKKKQFALVPFPLVFVGGFLYSMMSEGKSQYIIPYFIIMTAFSAYGIVWLYDRFAARVANNKICREMFLIPAPEKAAEAETAAEVPADENAAESSEEEEEKEEETDIINDDDEADDDEA